MEYTIDSGSNLTLVALLYIFLRFFGPLIVGLIVIGLILLAGYLIYRRFRAYRENESLVDGFRRVKKGSLLERIFKGLGL